MRPIKVVAAAAALVLAPMAGALAQMSIALDSPPDLERSGSYVWAHAFATYLTEHGMEVRELPRGSVGGEAELLDQLSTGLLEVSLSDVRTVGQIDPFIYGIRLPYIFDDVAHMDRVFEAEGLYDRINEAIAGSDVVLLALVPLGPPSGIANTRHPVAAPEDMADLRMRALDDAQIALYEAWGSAGTIVAWNEVPTALQTGIVDGYLNNAFVPVMFGHTDFLRYFTDARTILSMRAALASKTWYDGLGDAERALVDEAVSAATAANRAWEAEVSGSSLEDLRAAGVEVTVLDAEQFERFRELSRSVYASDVLPADQAEMWIEMTERHR